MLKPTLAVLACSVALLATHAQAQVNKCVDAGGKTFYSQAPCPPNSKSSIIRSVAPPAPPLPASAAAKSAGPKSAAELELDFRKRRTEQAEAARKDQDKATEAGQREENCRSSKGTLASIDSGGRQSRINEKGERYVLDDAQAGQERERARLAVEQWCK